MLASIAEFLRSTWIVWMAILFLAVVYWGFKPRRRRPERPPDTGWEDDE